MIIQCMDYLDSIRKLPKARDEAELFEYMRVLSYELSFDLLFPSVGGYSRLEYFAYLETHRKRDSYEFFPFGDRYGNPGPKLEIWPASRIVGVDERKRLAELAGDSDLYGFRVLRNGADKIWVPVLFDNMRFVLDGLEIEVATEDTVPNDVTFSSFFNQHGGYDEFRTARLNTEVRLFSVKDSVRRSYAEVNGTLPEDSALIEVLKDYTRIISRHV